MTQRSVTWTMSLHAHHDNTQVNDEAALKRFGGMTGLPLGSSLPISSGKALVQTETRLVSNTRREEAAGETRGDT